VPNAPHARADEPKPAKAERKPAAVSVSPRGMIIRREGGIGEKWLDVDEKEKLSTGDLLLGLPGARLESLSGGARLQFLTDLGGSPLPVLEAVVVLHESPGFDLDFTLDRGRVDVTNEKKTGAVKVRFRVREEAWEVILSEPGSRIALELYGRWPKGVRFTKTPGPKDVPVSEMVFFVLKGEAQIKHADKTYTMHAPPGPAQIGWDSTAGMERAPQRLEKAPDWANPDPNSPTVKGIRERVTAFSKLMREKTLAEGLETFALSDDPAKRRFAIIGMGATDELGQLGRVLNEPKYGDNWDVAVVVLRHWLGRAPGQDMLLYKRLIEVRKMTPKQAETILQLLHSFGDDDLAQPEHYQMLIDFLSSDVVGIRGLANWHLKRLVPAGEKIKFDALGPAEEREKARQEWKKLIPAGELPPKPKQDKP
jgi:hypothetical protein